MEGLDIIQQWYWQRILQATQYCLHDNVDAGLEILLQLQSQPDLSKVLRIMVNQSIIRETDQALQRERHDLLRKADELILDVVEELGEGHDLSIHVKNQQALAKAQIEGDEGKPVTHSRHIRIQVVPAGDAIDESEGEHEEVDDAWETVDEDGDDEEDEADERASQSGKAIDAVMGAAAVADDAASSSGDVQMTNVPHPLVAAVQDQRTVREASVFSEMSLPPLPPQVKKIASKQYPTPQPSSDPAKHDNLDENIS
ncbi:uncharacterized protein AB675_1210 [Cyphellophora attinorum]|uniref:Uncharacterized protein n=1 Tax=Cyphellophora attinorum TaxID=1664694 RepID=A0A0N1HLZ3_9EURO|nr:uncharacterized protein AB675_1210 [Phialophora attinorum]KPI35674.1 hypothetical protein AB675_1210 [Phialophora attinorum]